MHHLFSSICYISTAVFILCYAKSSFCSHIAHFPFHFFPLFEPKWLSNMKGKVEWARDSSLNVIGKTLWAKVLWTLRCSTLSSSTISFILQWQKGQSHFLFFSETLIFGSFGRGFRCKWRIQSLVELSQGLKKSWIKGIAEVAREVDWNLTGKTLCLRVLCICKCSFFSLLILTLQYGHNSIVLSNQTLRWTIADVSGVYDTTRIGLVSSLSAHCLASSSLRGVWGKSTCPRVHLTSRPCEFVHTPERTSLSWHFIAPCACPAILHRQFTNKHFMMYLRPL